MIKGGFVGRGGDDGSSSDEDDDGSSSEEGDIKFNYAKILNEANGQQPFYEDNEELQQPYYENEVSQPFYEEEKEEKEENEDGQNDEEEEFDPYPQAGGDFTNKFAAMVRGAKRGIETSVGAVERSPIVLQKQSMIDHFNLITKITNETFESLKSLKVTVLKQTKNVTKPI